MSTADIILSYFTNICGLFVFPVHSVDELGKCTCKKGIECSAAGKHPFLNIGWKKIATNKFEQIKNLTKNKNVNYAVVTGTKSPVTQKYLVVLDIDKQNHEILQNLPKTFCYRTGSGGYHYWFWSPIEIKNSVSKIAEKVDVRGTGGYVIVPPSKHKSGNKYELLCDINQNIVELPGDIINLLKQEELSKTSNKKKIKKDEAVLKVKNNFNKIILDFWTKTPVPEIRKIIESGIKIPKGVRNITIHRLLSSDRARGIATYENMMARSAFYKTCLEEPQSFDDKELRNIVVSVMRYPVYNTSAENVNKNYVKWMNKQGINLSLEEVEKEDKEFFSLLKPSENKFVSLEQINEIRKKWYDVKKIKNFANYKPQLFAAKLKSLGFKRKRTAQSNVWNVDVEDVIANIFCLRYHKDAVDRDRRQYKMSEIKEDVEQKKEIVPIGPDGKPLTLVEEREEFVQVDRKYHPDEYKYPGLESSQEIIMAQIKLFESLTPEQEEQYALGTLLVDEDRTRDFMSAIKPGDILGIKSNMYLVKSVNSDDLIVCKRKFDKYNQKYHFDSDEETINIYQLDNALSLGFCQILYRNNVPFGLDKEMAYKIKIKVYADSVGRTYIFKDGKKVTPIPNKNNVPNKNN